ncbi:MAG: hypothetical protein ACYTG2_01785 [Planctomycetota bacterium]|jgi:hypothetical protein
MNTLPRVLLVLTIAALAAGTATPADPPADPPRPSAAAAGFTLFELDGDAMQNAPPMPDDWQTLYDSGSNSGGHSVAFSGIVGDPGSTTIFDGGKKDTQDISQWSYKSSGGFPDKNNITNAYAAAYESAAGELIVYFGADRFSNTGDAYLGFWFFKDKIRLDEETGTFIGQHQVGDLLVIVNYPQGTTSTPELNVLEWNPAEQDVATNLRLRYSNVGPVCVTDPPDTVCASTNLAAIPAPWPYVPKSGTPGVFPPESFFEGGINLTQVLQEDTCFSSFMAETRSSTSVTATLKDFVLGDFPVCSLEVTKTCEVVSVSSDPTKFDVTFDATVENTGAGTFALGSKLVVVDDAGTPGDDADDVTVVKYLEAPLGPNDTVAVSGQFTSAKNPPNNTVTASIETPEVTVQSDAYSVDCIGLDLNPALELSKSCSLVLEPMNDMLVLRVDFTGHVKNTGDIPLLVTVDDDKAGQVLAPTVLVPEQSIPLSGYYYPKAAEGDITDPTSAAFADMFTATGSNPLLSEPVVEKVSANCPLCPGD